MNKTLQMKATLSFADPIPGSIEIHRPWLSATLPNVIENGKEGYPARGVKRFNEFRANQQRVLSNGARLLIYIMARWIKIRKSPRHPDK